MGLPGGSLVYDYYLRENAKVRPDFAPDQGPYWKSVTAWYAKAAGGPQFRDYEGYGYRQILHMTHAEVISRDFSQNGHKMLIIFDYRARNPLTGNAVTWEARGWTKDRE